MWQQRAAQTCPHSPGFSLWVLSSSEPTTFSHLLEMPGVTDGSLDRILPFSPQGSSHNNPVVLGGGIKMYFSFLPSRFTLYAVDTRGRHSELSTVTLRTACPLVDDSKAEGQRSGTSFSKTKDISC